MPIQNTASHVGWTTNEGFIKASAQYNKALDHSRPIMRSSAAIANRFQNIDNNTSVRDSFSSLDYSFFRPGETTPRHFRDIIAACLGAYQKVPVIRSTIDLMSDFTVQGIRIVHEDQEVENLFNEWFKKVEGHDRSERIANCLFKAGNVIIKRANAQLNEDIVNNWKNQIFKTAAQSLDVTHEEDAPIKPYEVPYRYTILNPTMVEVLGEQIAAFTGKSHYVLHLPTNIYNSLSIPLTFYDPSILTVGLPNDIQKAIDNNQRYLLLDSDKLVTLFYKKDDWDVWAFPMLYSLLDQMILLEKMKQADISALDGVISHIRIWKLGSLEHKAFPTDAAIQKLSNILLNHVAGGAMDFIWGPDLELCETSTDIGKWLGSEKYEFVMNTIHTGLGIPAAIGRSKGSMTDNFMSLRVLIERLNYGRDIITRFWQAECKLIQRSLGIKKAPRIMYANNNLTDEVAEKALWIRLLEEDVVPVSAVQEKFGRIPEIDNLLINREYAARNKGNMPDKAGPYHDAQPKLSLTKVFAQRGVITPSELPDGLDLDLKEPSPEHQDIIDSTFPDQVELKKAGPPKKKPKGKSGQGRPGGSKDKNKRKARTPKPSAKGEDLEGEFLSAILFANQAQKAISEFVTPYFLEKFNKKNVRSMTDGEYGEYEQTKFNLLFNTPYTGEVITESAIAEIVSGELETYDVVAESFRVMAEEIKQKNNGEMTVEMANQAKSYLYALFALGENDVEGY